MKHTNLTPSLYEYMQDIALREHPVLCSLRNATASMPLADMQIEPLQAQFMQWLLKLTNARKVLEIGTFMGYSALAMALALPNDGELITCDINADWTSNAHSFWVKAGVDHKIQLRLGPGITTMQELLNEGYSQQFDFIFIDADKTNYRNYYELALQLINPQGTIAIDNIFWDAKVIDMLDTSAQTCEIRRLNEHIKHDERVDISLLAIADGLFLIKPKLNA